MLGLLGGESLRDAWILKFMSWSQFYTFNTKKVSTRSGGPSLGRCSAASRPDGRNRRRVWRRSVWRHPVQRGRLQPGDRRIRLRRQQGQGLPLAIDLFAPLRGAVEAFELLELSPRFDDPFGSPQQRGPQQPGLDVFRILGHQAADGGFGVVPMPL